MSFEDDMLECGFSDEEDYIEHLVDDAVEAIEKRSDYEREDNNCIEWGERASTEKAPYTEMKKTNDNENPELSDDEDRQLTKK